MKGSFEYTIEGEDGEEFDVTVTYTYYPGSPGCMYLRNGDPGYPEEDAEVEIEKVVDAKGVDYLDSLPDSIMSLIEERAIEDAEANDGYYEYDEDCGGVKMDDKWDRIRAAVENCIADGDSDSLLADFLALRERAEGTSRPRIIRLSASLGDLINAWRNRKPDEEPDYSLCENVCDGSCPKCTKPEEPYASWDAALFAAIEGVKVLNRRDPSESAKLMLIAEIEQIWQSGPEPSECGGPAEGDLIIWPWGEHDEGVPKTEIIEDNIRAHLIGKSQNKNFVILMRRAEVEARVKESTK